MPLADVLPLDCVLVQVTRILVCVCVARACARVPYVLPLDCVLVQVTRISVGRMQVCPQPRPCPWPWPRPRASYKATAAAAS